MAEPKPVHIGEKIRKRKRPSKWREVSISWKHRPEGRLHPVLQVNNEDINDSVATTASSASSARSTAHITIFIGLSIRCKGTPLSTERVALLYQRDQPVILPPSFQHSQHIYRQKYCFPYPIIAIFFRDRVLDKRKETPGITVAVRVIAGKQEKEQTT